MFSRKQREVEGLLSAKNDLSQETKTHWLVEKFHALRSKSRQV